MKLTSDQLEALEIVQSTGDWRAIVSQVEFLLERTATETRAEMKERIIELVSAQASEKYRAGDYAGGYALEHRIPEIRSLLPDPDWLERKLLEARRDEAKWWHTRVAMVDEERVLLGETRERIADLDRQLAEKAHTAKS